MNSQYLGEEILDSLQGTPFEHFTPSQWALEFLGSYGQIDGGHHKTWVLDQVARVLHGTPVVVKCAAWDLGAVRQIEYRFETGRTSPAYEEWVRAQRGKDDEGYDEGIAP